MSLLPYRVHIEKLSFIRLLEQISTEEHYIIDLVCGGGWYTRIAPNNTKGKVVGVDISSEMVKLA
jgi:ubiquinone/menaquinone biosynthesis C-methylase UbiE